MLNYLFSNVDSEKERKCGPDGFIDSTRYRHNYVSKKDRRAAREQEKVAKLSAVDMALKTEKTKSDFIKRQKVIEVCYQNIDRIHSALTLFLISGKASMQNGFDQYGLSVMYVIAKM